MSVHFKPQGHNRALRDALYATQGGRDLAHDAKRVVIVQAKRQEVGDRIKTLKTLAHATFIGDKDSSLIPTMTDASGRRLVHGRPDVFFHAKDNMRELGRKGGAEYEHAITSLKFAYHDFYTYGRLNKESGRGSYRQAVQSILPPLKPADHQNTLVAEYDGNIRAEIAEEIVATEELHVDVESSDGLTRHEEEPSSEFVPAEILKQAE